ncbi:hypothetical protein AR457_18245 [Streptomyces agglomeratus]|uniref:DUF2797 domain-containing protein n=1 Tax=Streptomyces agglomeratus TaxID=285458 RepID=UPI000854DD6D|nr:DUF2797 domain-containing protein [Streptomyces agglomeratus]OEJ39827.1 hypothetical protein BGK70_18410 [Streptomyces agglomeratus]OEJ45794.1 hypothetical protein AR457_18245 [Streptomyces agglomeratus]
MSWLCGGLRWTAGRPALVWYGGGGRLEHVERVSELTYGNDVAFRVTGEDRLCVGVRRGGCPLRSVVPRRSSGGQCPECARLERSRSVAADTMADDPRPYAVYLAWFGPGMVKVGITADERGSARLLEQGAVAFTWLGRGPLMAARRAEELLRAALGVPDRIPYKEKRAVRSSLPGRAERAREIEELHRRAGALAGWPESLERAPFEAVDHAGVFGLEGLRPMTGVVTELAPDGTVVGRLLAAAGPDLHLGTADGAVVVLDTRLMSGWELAGVGPEGGAAAGVTVPVKSVERGVQGGLF